MRLTFLLVHWKIAGVGVVLCVLRVLGAALFRERWVEGLGLRYRCCFLVSIL